MCTGGESQARWKRLSVARSLQLCKVPVTVYGFFPPFSQLVSHHHMPFYYLENSLEFFCVFAVWVKSHWCVLNDIKLKFFLWCFGYVFSAAAIVSLFLCAGVEIVLEFGKKWWLSLCLIILGGWNSIGPMPLGLGAYWFRHTPPVIITWSSFPLLLCFGNVLTRYMEAGQRCVAFGCQGRCLSCGRRVWNVWNNRREN